MRGRKPQPTQLKLVKGNPGKRPLNENEPSFDVQLPEPPDCLDELALKEWWRVGGLLVKSGVMTAGDRAVLAAYCQSYSRWVCAEKKVNEFGAMVLSPRGGAVVSPWVGIAAAAQQAMLKAASDLGLTPVARSRVVASKKTATNPFDED